MSQIILVAYRNHDTATLMQIDEEKPCVDKIILRFRPWSLCFKLEIFRKTADGHRFFDRTFLVEQTEFKVTLEKSGKTFNIYGEYEHLSLPRQILNSQCLLLTRPATENVLTSRENKYIKLAWERIHAYLFSKHKKYFHLQENFFKNWTHYSRSAVQQNDFLSVRFETKNDPFAHLQNLFFVEAKIAVELDLVKFKDFAKLSSKCLPTMLRSPQFFAENKGDSITVSFVSFSPRNVTISLAVLLYVLENTNLETKDFERKKKVIMGIIDFVGGAEIKPNVKTKRKWTRVLTNFAEQSATKDFAKMYSFSM